jgi:hypothetical protein
MRPPGPFPVDAQLPRQPPRRRRRRHRRLSGAVGLFWRRSRGRWRHDARLAYRRRLCRRDEFRLNLSWCALGGLRLRRRRFLRGGGCSGSRRRHTDIGTLSLDREQHLPDLHRIARLHVQRLDHSRKRARQFDNRLLRLQFHHDLLCLDRVPDLDVNLRDIRRLDSLPQRGQLKVNLSRLLCSHLNRPLLLLALRSPRRLRFSRLPFARWRRRCLRRIRSPLRRPRPLLHRQKQVPHIHRVSHRHAHLRHRPRDRAGQFDDRLLGLEFRHNLPRADRVAGLDQQFRDVRRRDPFAETGEREWCGHEFLSPAESGRSARIPWLRPASAGTASVVTDARSRRKT